MKNKGNNECYRACISDYCMEAYVYQGHIRAYHWEVGNNIEMINYRGL